MRLSWMARCFGFHGLVLSVAFVGCGKQSTPVTEIDVNETTVAENSSETSGLPLLAVPGPDGDKDAAPGGKVTKASATGKSGGPSLLPKRLLGKKAENSKDIPEPAAVEAGQPVQNKPEKGSPEWLLSEIDHIKLLPLPHEAEFENESEDEEDDDKPLTPEQEKKLTEEIERNKSIRRDRNTKIIKLAEGCIQKTNNNPEQEGLFNTAVHHLLDARFQLALQGDDESMKAIYEADAVFFKRNPKSESASEAALTLVNLTHANAVRYGRKDPRWLHEFSKQTQSYASRFPDEAPRAVPLLMAAARSCEMNGQPDEAKACYQVLETKFKGLPQSQQATNVLKRLQLKGTELELAGPGIDGGQIDVKSMKGKMVLVVFWATNAQPFNQQLPKLLEVVHKYRKYVTVVGVNLDVEETAVDAFVEKNHLDWVQIFPENREQRGWSSPLAIEFGVNSLPTMFLTDPNGIVTETNLDSENLEVKIRETYEPFRKKTASNATK